MASKAHDCGFAANLDDLVSTIKNPLRIAAGFFENIAVRHAAARLHSGGKATISIQ